MKSEVLIDKNVIREANVIMGEINSIYQKGYLDGKTDAIDELFNRKVFNNNTESIFDVSLKECRNDFDDGWNRCYHDFMEVAEQLK